jgi:hypothetical protein
LRCSSFALVLVLTAWRAPAQNPDAYTPTGNLTVPRTFHTATLVPNGNVFLAGGSSRNIPTSSTELYNPSTGTFTAAGDMTTPRYEHTATLLPDGKVLITGGLMRGEGGLLTPQATAELYDPWTGSFMATGSMTVPRNRHVATLLHNGKVLIVGGSRPVPNRAWPPYQSAEFYDPSTGTFTATGDMTEPGADTATLLPNGKVLITKCVDDCYNPAKPSHAELYDPSSGTFARTGDMVDALQGAGPKVILLMDGKVLVAGGDLNVIGSAIAQIYDPAVGVFVSTGKMTADIEQGAAVLLPDGSVFISGESISFATHPIPGATGATELYDPISGAFGPPMASRPLWGQAATLLPNGTVLQSGGCCLDAAAEIYHPAVLVASPKLFSLSGDARAPGAIRHAGTERVVSPGDPAVAGEALEIYCAGLIDGAVIPPLVAIGGRLAEVLYFGAAPGYAGLNQINVRVPNGIPSGPDVPVRLNYLSRPSNEVTLAVH